MAKVSTHYFLNDCSAEASAEGIQHIFRHCFHALFAVAELMSKQHCHDFTDFTSSFTKFIICAYLCMFTMHPLLVGGEPE